MATEITDGVYVLGFKHAKVVMQHFVTMVQELFFMEAYNFPMADLDRYYASKFDIYIGNDATYSNNPKCPLGPFLRNAYDDYFDESQSINGYFAAFGFEAACNMEGQYTYLVATNVPTDYVSICSAAVFGTTYARPTTALTALSLGYGVKISYKIGHIAAEDAIGNIISIDLRQKSGSELDFVSFTNNSADTDVEIDGATLGDHTLILESYDLNSKGVNSALKTDTITITVVAVARSTPLPTSTTTISMKMLESKSFSIPKIDMNHANTQDPDVLNKSSPDINLRILTAPYVSFTENSDSTDVVIDGTHADISTGSIDLVLESFDTTASETPTIVTDTISLTVYQARRVDALQSTIEVKAPLSSTISVANIEAPTDIAIGLR